MHACGAKAIAYGAVYGAESFQEEHPECSYRYDNGEPMIFIDKIWLMDIHRGTAWEKNGFYRNMEKRWKKVLMAYIWINTRSERGINSGNGKYVIRDL